MYTACGTRSYAINHPPYFRQQAFDYQYQYRCENFPLEVQSALITNRCDEGTSAFLQNCYQRHGSICSMFVDQLSLVLLKPWFSTTTVNALAFRGE